MRPATLTVRELAAMAMLDREWTDTRILTDLWRRLPYDGKLHDAMYRLARRGYAERCAAQHSRLDGTAWRLTQSGVETFEQLYGVVVATTRQRRRRRRRLA